MKLIKTTEAIADLIVELEEIQYRLESAISIEDVIEPIEELQGQSGTIATIISESGVNL